MLMSVLAHKKGVSMIAVLALETSFEAGLIQAFLLNNSREPEQRVLASYITAPCTRQIGGTPLKTGRHSLSSTGLRPAPSKITVPKGTD
jgi:hypothetical protein